MKSYIKEEAQETNQNCDRDFVAKRDALLKLGFYLKDHNYQFVTITPESHRLVLSRDNTQNKSDYSTYKILRDLFGWNVPVLKKDIPPSILALLLEARAVKDVNSLSLQSKVRFSTVGDNIFLHSSYPTSQNDAVFFGPDTYRFIRFLKAKVKTARIIVDLGCGPGTGGIVLTNLLQAAGNQVQKLYLGDINETALRYSLINAELNNIKNAKVILSNMLDTIPRGADLIIANPPFIMDVNKRTYRDGGSNYGSQISFQMVQSALQYLEPGGTLALYTGSCIIQGKDIFFEQIEPIINSSAYEYEEIDCDIFGEELAKSSYHNVERIAAVSLLLRKQ